MHSVQAAMWNPQPPSKHASPLTVPPPSTSRLTHVTTAAPAKRITFYKSGDSQFGGVRMAIHKRSFKCFDALLDDLSQKVPLPFGVRTVTTPRGTHTIKHLEQLRDGGCYLCSDRRQAKPINMELASKCPSIWYHHGRKPQQPESSSTTPSGHLPYRQRRILLVKNSEPGMRRSLVLSRRSTRNLKAFLDEVSEVMQFHVRKLYTAEGRRIDNVQSLMTCPGVLVCVGREAFSPVLVNFIRKSSEEKLWSGLGSRSPGLGPRTPGNGARSPATQGVRSPPHGAQSTASEYSEGHESKKNVNFGLETKKSIIHPRSDSSNRSTRFSLSSEKSYSNGVSASSQAKPAFMNDDIEKRVLVNKDGSLSVEMRVRFRLHSDETLQWSTQIKKSPSLTNESCPLSQAELHYLQQGQSESCSDPDSTSFDPEHVDYSNQPLQHVLGANHCPCCSQRREAQYDLWENSAHGQKHSPVPPPHPHTSSHAHSIMRHTHSSSSSSSCNSRRVVRCRAQLSSCRGGSGSGQSELVQEEMCMTEQVEHRVDMEQDGDTHVKVCRVSQSCSHTEVVAMETNLQPLSRKSVVDELEEDEAERPVSAVSSSSHVLQSLKEDQDDEDDDLPTSASQCCHCSEPCPSPASQTQLNNKPSSKVSEGSVYSTEHKKHEDGETRESRAISAASSCHHRAVTPESTAVNDEMDRASSTKSKMSRASCRSSKAKVPNSEEKGVADDEDEEVKRVSSLSGHTGLSAGSQKSMASNVCPVCGGCKLRVSSLSNIRASPRARHSHQASPNPATLLSNKENGKNGIDNDDSDDSAVSTQSNKTNLTNQGCLTNGLEGRASSAMSKMSSPEPAGNEEDRSHKSNCSNTAEAPDIRTREEAEGENAAERAVSSMSAKSGVSANTNATVKSHKSQCPLSSKVASFTENTIMEEQGDTNKRASSSLSVKSNASAKSGQAKRPDSALSANSNVTSGSTCSHCVTAVSPGSKIAAIKETGQEQGTKVEERAASAMSGKSNLSVKSNKSHKSTKASERSLSPRSETKIDGEERTASQMSAKSVKSCRSNCNGNATNSNVAGESEEKENKMTEVETQQRPESVMSAKSEKEERAASARSSKCNGNTEANSERGDNTKDSEKPKDRAASALSCTSASSAKSHHTKTEVDDLVDIAPTAMSVNSHTSAMSSKSQKSHTAASPDPSEAVFPSIETKEEEAQQESHKRVASAMSVKSKCSSSSAFHETNSVKTPKSVSPSHNVVTIKTPDGFDEEGNETVERASSTASAKSEKSNCSSALSHNSNHDGTPDVAAYADMKVVEDNTDSHGQMLSPKGICFPRAHSPKVRSPRSSVQQLLPSGETKGSSALSVQSTTSAISGRSKCCCGAASIKKDKYGEDKDMVNKEENEELKREQGSERAASIMSSSSKRGTKQPLSRNSSGSLSLGLPEDQETAESDSGKSNVSFHTNTKNKGRASAHDVPKNPEESSVMNDLDGTGSTMSQKSNSNHSKNMLSNNAPAVDIPNTDTPGEGEDGKEDGEQNNKRTDSSFSAVSSSSHKSSCKCSFEAVAQVSKSKSKEEHVSASPNNAESVRSGSTKKASNLDTPDNRTSSVMSSRGPKVRNKCPVSGSPKNVKVLPTNIGDSANQAASSADCEAKGQEAITNNRNPCSLRPESAASAQSKQNAAECSVKSNYLKPVKGQKSKSNTGSDSGSVKTSNSHKKEMPLKSSNPCLINRPCSKVETCSESTLSPSLSAADLLKETIAEARPHSCQSKASKASNKHWSEKSTRCLGSKRQKDQEELELMPTCLPNASPNEIVSNWLRSIPANGSMLELADELNEPEQEKEMEEKPGEEVANEEDIAEDETLDKEETTEVQEEEENGGEANCEKAEEEKSSDPAPGDAAGTASCPNTLLMSAESPSRNWNSSAAVMKVLLSSSLGRCQSMPEVSPVYGRRLSTSARGLLDCLAQLQLIEPTVSPGCDQQKDRNQQYENIMAILQSLWLTEPKDTEAMEAKDDGMEQVSPPRSSSGVGMSSGSGGSGKENGNQVEDEAPPKETELLNEDEGAEKVVEEEEDGNAELEDKEIKAEPEDTSTEQAPQSVDSTKATDNPSWPDKSSANDSFKSPTDTEQETLADTSSGTPPTVLRAPLTKRFSQDPDPVWVLHLLKKLEKQFMSHYINAMAEFKVRWDLDDSLILNTMMMELKDEVSRRIQSSIEHEMRKIQSRAGKGGRSPRPPQGGNLSRESTMTEKRRRMLKVMKNQSAKTADSVSDEEMIGDFSDQRSDDEYCPCDACVRKKMAARPLKTNPMAAEAPVMMEFDLLKILQLKKSPLPAAVPQPVEVEGEEENEERNLEAVQEEEEEDETKEDIKPDIFLEETIPEKDEEIQGQKEDGGEEGKEEEVGAESEGNNVGDGEQEEGQKHSEEVGKDEALGNGEQEKEKEKEEAECQCHNARNEEESHKGEEEEGEMAGEEAEETGEDETADDEERAGEEEFRSTENEGEAGDNEGEIGTGEDKSNETVKEATAGEGETTENEEGEQEAEVAEDDETTGRGSEEEEASPETEDDSNEKNKANEESTMVDEFAEGNSASAEGDDEDDGHEGESHEDEKGGETAEQEGEASEEEKASPSQEQGLTPPVCLTEGEEADAEDSDTDSKRPSETSVEESGHEVDGTTGDKEQKEEGEHGEEGEVVEDAMEEFKSDDKEEGTLLHQFTRTSVESQPGSLEDIVTD